jgi:hypothetical protein
MEGEGETEVPVKPALAPARGSSLRRRTVHGVGFALDDKGDDEEDVGPKRRSHKDIHKLEKQHTPPRLGRRGSGSKSKVCVGGGGQGGGGGGGGGVGSTGFWWVRWVGETAYWERVGGAGVHGCVSLKRCECTDGWGGGAGRRGDVWWWRSAPIGSGRYTHAPYVAHGN